MIAHPILPNTSLVSRTAEALTDLSLKADPGDYLGAESELIQKLGVSRPTLRQAARMVERDHLLSIRRGVHGGYFAERPDTADAIRTLARFLRLQGATLADVMQLTQLIAEELTAAAARQRSETDVRLLTDFITDSLTCQTPRDMIRAEARLVRLVAKLSGNPAAGLFMEIGYGFGLQEKSRDLYATPERCQQGQQTQRNICTAIIDGDPELARLMMRRRYQQIRQWLGLGEFRPT